jgi:hypothetical protein
MEINKLIAEELEKFKLFSKYSPEKTLTENETLSNVTQEQFDVMGDIDKKYQEKAIADAIKLTNKAQNPNATSPERQKYINSMYCSVKDGVIDNKSSGYNKMPWNQFAKSQNITNQETEIAKKSCQNQERQKQINKVYCSVRNGIINLPDSRYKYTNWADYVKEQLVNYAEIDISKRICPNVDAAVSTKKASDFSCIPPKIWSDEETDTGVGISKYFVIDRENAATLYLLDDGWFTVSISVPDQVDVGGKWECGPQGQVTITWTGTGTKENLPIPSKKPSKQNSTGYGSKSSKKVQWNPEKFPLEPLKYMDQGPNVKRLQQALDVRNKAGKPNITGNFYNATQAALDKKAKELGLSYDRNKGLTKDDFDKILAAREKFSSGGAYDFDNQETLQLRDQQQNVQTNNIERRPDDMPGEPKNPVTDIKKDDVNDIEY